MKKFIIEENFWSMFPKSKIGIVICNGINNSTGDKDKYKEMIENAEKEALKYLKDDNFSSNEVIKVWREAFKNSRLKRVQYADVLTGVNQYELCLLRIQKMLFYA